MDINVSQEAFKELEELLSRAPEDKPRLRALLAQRDEVFRDMPWDEAKARELADCLHNRGIRCDVHQDRSPWGVRIPLTADLDEGAPTLYVLTEEQREIVTGTPAVVWHGQITWHQVESPFTSELIETSLEWIERPWLGNGTPEVADAVVALLRLLRLGAERIVEIDKDTA